MLLGANLNPKENTLGSDQDLYSSVETPDGDLISAEDYLRVHKPKPKASSSSINSPVVVERLQDDVLVLNSNSPALRMSINDEKIPIPLIVNPNNSDVRSSGSEEAVATAHAVDKHQEKTNSNKGKKAPAKKAKKAKKSKSKTKKRKNEAKEKKQHLRDQTSDFIYGTYRNGTRRIFVCVFLPHYLSHGM